MNIAAVILMGGSTYFLLALTVMLVISDLELLEKYLINVPQKWLESKPWYVSAPIGLPFYFLLPIAFWPVFLTVGTVVLGTAGFVGLTVFLLDLSTGERYGLTDRLWNWFTRKGS